MNTISFYMPLDGKTRDLAAFITESLIPCGYSFNWCADNGKLQVSGYPNSAEQYIVEDATEYGWLTEPE